MSKNNKTSSQIKNTEEKIKLNLGCSKKKIYGFINIDADKLTSPDICCDAFVLADFSDNSVDLIFASHILEHSNRKTYKEILKRWYDVLKPGGTLRIAVPNLERVFEHYMLYKDLKLLLGFLYGGQRNEYDFHYMGWDFKTLKRDLCEVGFSDVKLYDRNKTEHSNVDDYSASYLPHKDFETGVLMSLNIEAKKWT